VSCLVIKNDGVGDLILASGIIRSLAGHFDGAVDLVTCATNQEVAEGIAGLRERFYVSRDEIRFRRRAAAHGWLLTAMPREDRATLQRLGTRQYDVAVCLRRFIRQSSLAIMRSVNARHRYCSWQFPTNTSRELAERCSAGWDRFDAPATVRSESDYGRAFVEDKLGISLNPTPRLGFCRLQTALPGGRQVALGIGGTTARWPAGNWLELATSLAGAGWRLILLGGPEAGELGSFLAAEMPATRNLVGQASLRETAELLGDCDAYLGNDTGLAHLASLVSLKCLIIIGGGTFRRFFPWPGATNQYVIFHGLECYDCDWSCRYAESYCLTLIRPSRVFRYFQEMMTDPGTARERDTNETNVAYLAGWRRAPDGTRLRVRANPGDTV